MCNLRARRREFGRSRMWLASFLPSSPLSPFLHSFARLLSLGSLFPLPASVPVQNALPLPSSSSTSWVAICAHPFRVCPCSALSASGSATGRNIRPRSNSASCVRGRYSSYAPGLVTENRVPVTNSFPRKTLFPRDPPARGCIVTVLALTPRKTVVPRRARILALFAARGQCVSASAAGPFRVDTVPR